MILFFIFLWGEARASSQIDWPRWQLLQHKDIQENSRYWLAGKDASVEGERSATIEAFKTKSSWGENSHPQCRYPARRMLLLKEGEGSFQISPCPDFDEWINKVNPQGASLVFAGNYPDNPGSLFGHTFLKFNSQTSTSQPIMDYALNYSAEVSDDFGLLYAFKGLTGGYSAGFMLTPYYIKLNEYNEGEGRDIWEYELALTPEEVTLILAHVWELKYQAQFRYYFLDENCSFFILRLIDFARPDWQLEKKIPWYVIPLETVKVLHEKTGMVKSVRYRPSVRLRAQAAFAGLGSNQKSQVLELLNGVRDVSKSDDSLVLQTAAMRLASLHSQRDGRLRPEEEKREDEILSRLSDLPHHKEMSFPNLPSPHEGHDVNQIGVGYLTGEERGLLISTRLGVHDQLDAPTGYLPFSELLVLDSRWLIEDEVFKLDYLDLLKITLLRPVSLEEFKVSWKADVLLDGRSQLFTDNATVFRAEGLMGLSTLTHRDHLVALLGGVHASAENLRAQQVGGVFELSSIFKPNTFTSQQLIKLYHITSGEHDRLQLVPESSFSVNPTKDLDLSVVVRWPFQLEEFFATRFQVSTMLEYHF